MQLFSVGKHDAVFKLHFAPHSPKGLSESYANYYCFVMENY